MVWRTRSARIAALCVASLTAACTSSTTAANIRSAEDAAEVRFAPRAAQHTEVPIDKEREARGPDEAAIATRVDLPSLEAIAIARQPSLVAAAHRVRALALRARAEGKLPPPELMADMWQVPFAKPYALDKAGMIMFTLKQQFPAAGALDRVAEAIAEEAHAEVAKATAEAIALVRDVDRAFADYASASARHEAHGAHRVIVEQMVAAARARYSTGGALGDFTRAELELARTDAEIEREHGMIGEARARLNGLLVRAADAPLGAPSWGEPRSVSIGPEEAARIASAQSPDVAMAERMAKSAHAMAQAADREATVPMFTAGVSASMPTNGMQAGYGLTFAMSLPWAWGGASGKHKAEEQKAYAARATASGAKIRARTEASVALASVRAAERRFLILRDLAAPAARRALEATRAGYAARGTDLLMWLDAARAAREIDVDLAAARGDLDRALADLDWAAGAHLPRIALPASKDLRHAP